MLLPHPSGNNTREVASCPGDRQCICSRSLFWSRGHRNSCIFPCFFPDYNPCADLLLISEMVSIHKWHFSAISASIRGIACATYDLYGSAQSLDLLDLAKNCAFLNWKQPSAHYLIFGWTRDGQFSFIFRLMSTQKFLFKRLDL
jgi:hypothetical protein